MKSFVTAVFDFHFISVYAVLGNFKQSRRCRLDIRVIVVIVVAVTICNREIEQPPNIVQVHDRATYGYEIT